jgi:hypothetical protein
MTGVGIEPYKHAVNESDDLVDATSEWWVVVAATTSA